MDNPSVIRTSGPKTNTIHGTTFFRTISPIAPHSCKLIQCNEGAKWLDFFGRGNLELTKKSFTRVSSRQKRCKLSTFVRRHKRWESETSKFACFLTINSLKTTYMYTFDDMNLNIWKWHRTGPETYRNSNFLNRIPLICWSTYKLLLIIATVFHC